jgi:hypothetical protein
VQDEFDRFYCFFLTAGFMALRRAAEANDAGWLNSEIELLHNVPSLIGSDVPGRHSYFWTKEGATYTDYVKMSGREAQRSHMRTYYEPIWRDMEPLVSVLLQNRQ